MKNRVFQLDSEWNMIHYPEKPIGFGVMIIGDERHFVDERSSFWIQNGGKFSFIKCLTETGYTVFYSNLYRRNWGSDRAVNLAKRLYEFVIRSEIINNKIHVLAEGMGALVALKLSHEMTDKIRSIVLINPVLSLKDHLEQEKEHKFFYKKLIKELSDSYEMETREVEDFVQNEKEVENLLVPTKIIHVLSSMRAYKQSKRLKQFSVKWEDEKAPITIQYVVPEKVNEIKYDMLHFFKCYESIL